MDNLSAKPRLLKQANLSLIRRVIKLRGTATRAEIVRETMISSTTVRSLLAEMLQNGEIESIGYDASSGGRKAERYGLRPDRYHCAALCMTDGELHALLVNVCGEIVGTSRVEMRDGDFESAILRCLDNLAERWELRAIGLGVPGVVEGGSFLYQAERGGALRRSELGDTVAARYGLPVVLENDLNATAIGFGRCYAKEYPQENPEHTNMAYLHFEADCIGAGFLSGGQIVRGCNNYAGELGLIPLEDGKRLYERLSEPIDDGAYTALVVRLLAWVCTILNPQYIVLSGPTLRRGCVGPAAAGLAALLPPHMRAEILDSPDVWRDFHAGMAHLAAARMFDDVQIVKE